MFCKNCGTDISNAKYCPNCGTCVEKEEPLNKDIEDNTRKLSIPQLKGLVISAVFIGWSLLLITASLIPYISAEIKMDYSNYDTNTYLYPALYLFAILIFLITGYKEMRKSNYCKSTYYKLSNLVTQKISGICTLLIYFLIIEFSIYSNRIITNSDLWLFSGILTVIVIALSVFWCIKIKRLKFDNCQLAIVTILLTFKETLISTVLLIATTLLLNLSTTLGVCSLLLMFLHAIVKLIYSTKKLKSVFKIS